MPAVKALDTLRKSVFWISLPFGMLRFGLPIYGLELGANAVEIGLFFSAFSLMTVLLRPVVGTWLDRHGRRPFLVGGLAGYGISMLAFASIQRVWGVVLARALQGIASSMMWLSASAITADEAEAGDRARAFGRVDQAGYRGAMLGAAVGMAVLLAWGDGGWGPLFVGYAATGVATTAFAWRRMPETNPTHRAPSEGSPSPIRWTRAWALLLLVTMVTAGSWTLISPILMIFLQDKLGAGVMELALAYLPASLIWAALPSRLGLLADRFGRKAPMVVALVVAAASSFFIPWLTSLAGLAALWALQALCFAAGDPAEQALVADLTGGEQRGRGYGLYRLASGLGATVGPVAGGWLYEAAGVRAPFYANGAILAASALILALLLQPPSEGEGDRPLLDVQSDGAMV